MLHKCSILKVANVFFIEPSLQHYLKEISKKANLSHTSTKTHLLELKRLNIIEEHIEKKGKRNFPIFRANINNPDYRKYKQINNLYQLHESKLIEFISDSLMPKSIVLFGSYLRGEDIEDSDIDLFVECKKETILISKYEKILNRKIQLHFKDNFNKFPLELKNNIINGLTIKGNLELK
jgi:predicted nucleotidyltransferase